MFLLILSGSKCEAKDDIFIRLNQHGYLPGDIKTAVIISNEVLSGKQFSVLSSGKAEKSFTGLVGQSLGTFGEFKYSYQIDFSKLKKRGNYKVVLGSNRTAGFSISNNIYNEVVDTLMQFFKIQRCGYTNPSYHDICHKYDATSLIINGREIAEKYDVSGGWHDAADYVKFINTTAYSVYTMLFAYDFDRKKFGFDNDKNGVPDIIEEAKVGLDWLLRCNYKKYQLITQVQDLRDHDVGWRLPEDDPMEDERPAFIGIGKNLVGIYTATMALAYRIWSEKYDNNNFANNCLTAAENIYSVRNSAQDIDTTGTGHYRDNEYKGKLALGAIEMYITTQNDSFLEEAIKYANEAGSDYWWSWGNINSYAHYRIAKYKPEFANYIKNNLDVFYDNSRKKTFGEGVAPAWGSNNTMLGVTLQSILYDDLKNTNKYDSLAVTQRDYVLGRNQWGISFVEGIGKRSSRNFHHQISFLKTKRLPGGFAAGPVSKEYLDSQNIPFENPDEYKRFQTDEAVYRDDRMDYITNEPTISANATAIFVMGYYSSR